MPASLFEPFTLKEPRLLGQAEAPPAERDHLADPLADPLAAPVQFEGGRGAAVHEVAREGLEGSSGALPFGDTIQRAFGRHDISGARASTGAKASEACDEMGASAYATGSEIAFKGSPDLHTAAHEAAHVVQQQHGVQLDGGVGQAGDRYEENADAVADAVVAGESAEPLLDGVVDGPANAGGVQAKAVQRQEEFHTGAGGRSGGDGTSVLKGAAVGFATGFAKNLAFGLPHIKGWWDDMKAIRAKDENSPRNRVYSVLGEGWRSFDMVKETVQGIANVATGMSVAFGLLSLIPAATAVCAPVATIAGVVATIAHGLAGLMRAAKIGAITGALTHVTGAQDRAALRSSRVREGVGLFINFIGWVFGAVGGVWNGNMLPTGGGENMLALGHEGAAGTGAALGMGEIGNRAQDIAGGGGDNYADGIDQKAMLNWESSDSDGVEDPDADLFDISLSEPSDMEPDWDSWDDTYSAWGDVENDEFVDHAGEPIEDVSAYMGTLDQVLSGSDDLADREIQDAASLPDVDTDAAHAQLGRIADSAMKLDKQAQASQAVDDGGGIQKGKVDRGAFEKAEKQAEAVGVKSEGSSDTEGPDTEGSDSEDVQLKPVQMGILGRIKDFLFGGVKKVRKLYAKMKGKLVGALADSAGVSQATAQLDAQLGSAEAAYEKARAGTADSADAAKKLKGTIGDVRAKL